jgi:hypothetical protein
MKEKIIEVKRECVQVYFKKYIIRETGDDNNRQR